MSTELKTLNGYGFDATKLGGLDAQYYAQGRAAHNLLDNSDFTNPVNQRGATSYSSQGYSIDRWKSEIAAGTSFSISVSSGKLIISKSGGVLRFYQILNNDMLGKTVTYAVKTSDGIFSGTCVVNNTINNVRIGSHNAYLSVYIGDSGKTIFSIFFNDSSDDTIEIYCAALYEGSYDASTIPAYQPKGYAAELAECQRLFRRDSVSLPCIAGSTLITGYAFQTKMRINPTYTIMSLKSWTSDGFTDISQNISSIGVNQGGVSYIEVNTAFEKPGLVLLSADFSADL